MCRLNSFSFGSSFLYSLLFFVSFAQASPNSITFQSRIVKPDGFPLEAAAVNFRISLTDTVGSCVIYQEDFSNRDMTGNKGLINLAIGTGSKVFPVGAMTLAQAFNNYNSPTLNCQAGGSIVAGATDRRKLIVQFNDGSGWQTVPAMDINSNPYALQADSAFKLGDYPAADYVRTATFPTCVGGEALHFNGASFTCVLVGGGSGTVTSVTSANSDIGVATTTTTPVLTLNVGTGANQIVKLNGTSQLPAVSGANLTNLNASQLASGTVPAAQMPALTGDVTMTAGTTATTIANNAVTNTHVAAAAAITRTKLASGTANHVLINDGSGVMSSLGCANTEVIKWVAGVPTCSTDLAGVGDIINGGNTTGAAVVVGTNDAQSLQFETNNSPAMTILSGGNVGVGTTSPTASAEVVRSTSGVGVKSTVSSTGLTNAAFQGISNGNSSGLNVGAELSASGSASANQALRIPSGFPNVGASNYAIFSQSEAQSYFAGNVGIGTTTPGSPLHVKNAGATLGTAFGTVFYGEDNTGFLNAFRVRVKDNITDLGADYTGGTPATNLTFSTRTAGGGALTERVRIDSTGNVGIGNSPAGNAKLEVSGQIVSQQVTAGAAVTAINFSQGNVQLITSAGGSALTLTNLRNGGTYVLVIEDTTSRTYTFPGCTNSYYSPANAPTVVGTFSTYSFVVVQNGANINCYISWVTGYL